MNITPSHGRSTNSRGARRLPSRDFGDEMERFINQLFAEPRVAFTPAGSLNSLGAGSYPAIDLDETDDSIRVTAELPGVDPETVDVRVTGDVLTIEGERSEKREEGDGARRYTERYYGRFSRSIQLPDTVDAEKVEAEYTDGEVIVTAPKKQRTPSRKVEIKSKSTRGSGDRPAKK
jgi:HSP20 family protein